MKKTLTDLTAVTFLITMFIVTFIACGYTENGDFAKVIPCMVIEAICCVIIFLIARYNTRKAERKAREARIARQKANARTAREEAYKNATMAFITSIPTPESADTYKKRISACEDLALKGLGALVD